MSNICWKSIKKAMVGAILLTFSCAPPPDSEPVSESESALNSPSFVQQKLIGSQGSDPIALGEGVSVDVQANTGTGNFCVPFQPELTAPQVRPVLPPEVQIDETAYNSPFHRFFWMNDADDVERMVTLVTEAQDGRGMLDFDDLLNVATDHYDQVFRTRRGPILSGLVVIPSADLNAEYPGPASSTEECVESSPGSPVSSQPTSLEEWVQQCGVRYLAEDKRGYYFFFSASVDQLEANFQSEPEEGWAHLTRLFQIENYDNQTGSVDVFETVQNLYPNIEFFVTGNPATVGYPGFLEGNRFMMGIRHFEEFVEFYQGAAQTAISTEDLPALGTTIWQATPVYDGLGYLEEICGIESDDIALAFGCYQHFEEALRVIERKLKSQVGIYIEALAAPNEYQQPNDAADWSRFLNQSYYPLLSALPGLRSDCENALASGDSSTICAACDVEPIADVLQDFASLTEPRPKVHAQHPTAQGVTYYDFMLDANQPPRQMPITGAFCGMHFLSGKFVGGAEMARMTRSGSNWELEAASNQTAPGQRLRTQMTCTPSITSGGNCGGAGIFCAWHEKCSGGVCVPDPYYTGETVTTSLSVNNNTSYIYVTPPHNVSPPLSDKPYLTLFSGISGNMRGLGEEVHVEQNGLASAAELRVESQQGYLEGWVTGTLLTDASSTSHAFVDLDPDPSEVEFDASVDTVGAGIAKAVERTLAPANQAFCYMTSAGGKFDGAGESIRLVRKSGVWVAQARSVGYTKWTTCPGWLACGYLKSVKQLRMDVRCISFDQ